MLNPTRSRALALALVAVAALQALFPAAPALAATMPGGELKIMDDTGQPAGACPLKHTDVTADIAGFVGRVTVKQIFHNPLDRKIEAVYVFPLPQDAAVDDMIMTVGDRRIVGQIKPREEARQVYEQAKAAGHVASLLDQERPNIFTQSIANIEPGVQITIEISYVETLKYEDGQFEWVFPMVVGPRYIPGTPISKTPDGAPPPDHIVVPQPVKPLPEDGVAHPSRSDGWGHDEGKKNNAPGTITPLPEDTEPNPGIEKQPGVEKQPGTKTDPKGHGWSPDTDRVPDASRITPPVVKPGLRAGHDISVSIKVDAGIPVGDIDCTSHDITRNQLSPTSFMVSLKNQAEIPNKDFILHYRPVSNDIDDGILVHQDERGRFISLILQPPHRVRPAQIVPRELIFVLDTSGSMSGYPIEKAKKVMNMALDAMQTNDTFNVITFAGDTRILWDKPRLNTTANRNEAQQFLNGHAGGGGTEMMKAIHAALAGEHDSNTVRIVCFMTDGYVGNDFEIIDAVTKNAGTTRVFSFGIGSSVNRFLLDGMARAGRGEVEYVTLESQGDAAAPRFHERILAPVLTDIEIDWGDLPVSDVYPQRVPDLFSSKPIMVCARLAELKDGEITLRGRTADGPVKRIVSLKGPWNVADGPSTNHPTLAPLWARAKVDHLMNQDLAALQRGDFPADLKKQITELGLAYRLMTQFTSFVAVEEMRVTVGGEAKTIAVPVEMPEGVSYEGVFGGGGGGRFAGGLFGGGGGGGMVTTSGAMPAACTAPPAEGKVMRIRATGGVAGGRAVTDRDEKEVEGTFTWSESQPITDPLSKLDADLRGATENLDKLDEDGNGTIGTLKVTNHRVAVMIVLTDTKSETLQTLKDLGFLQDAESKTVKLLIGTIDVRKLKELAALTPVVNVRPVGP